MGELIDARLAAVDAVHDLVADGLSGAGRDEEVQELRSLGRREFPCHRGEEIIAQKLADVTSEVLFKIQDFEGGQSLRRAVMLNAQRKLIERDVAVAQVILDYRAQVVDGDIVALGKMYSGEDGHVRNIEHDLRLAVIGDRNRDVGHLRRKH